jgi:ferrous iron transport protein A
MTSTRIAGRRHGRAQLNAPARARTLADLPPGAQATVIRVVALEPALAARLADLGFTPGTVVRMVRRAPLRDPVIYRVKDYELCLRRALAACVHVEVDH